MHWFTKKVNETWLNEQELGIWKVTAYIEFFIYTCMLQPTLFKPGLASLP